MDMEKLISCKVGSISLSPIRRFSNMVSKVPGALSLTIGQPDFKTPYNIKEAGMDAIKSDKTAYTHNQGYPELRKEIGRFLSMRYNLNYGWEEEITVTVGASQAIDTCLRTFINEGDEVIIPSPGYVAYEACVTLAGGRPVFVPVLFEDGFKLKASTLRKYITPRTKLIILSYPSNPTGATMDKEDLEKICEVIKENNIITISDEVYSELTYNKKHVSIAAMEDMKDRTIVINGFSKTYSMTGWRLGFIAASANVMKHIVKVHQYNVSCAPSISQAAGIEALRNGDISIKDMVSEYDKRRIYCFNRLKNMALDCFEPSGAFYIFPQIKKYKMPSEEFCIKLLNDGKLAAVPGSAFGEFGEGHIRISYAYSMEVLEEGLNRLEKFLGTLAY